MKMTDLKINERQSIDEQINAFFSKGGQIEQVPTNIYRHEELTQTARRTMLETSVAKLDKKTEKPIGHAMRDAARIAWKKREMKAAKK